MQIIYRIYASNEHILSVQKSSVGIAKMRLEGVIRITQVEQHTKFI